MTKFPLKKPIVFGELNLFVEYIQNKPNLVPWPGGVLAQLLGSLAMLNYLGQDRINPM